MFEQEKAVFIVKSLLAGVMIGFGAIVYCISDNHYVGDFLFAVGLMTVILKGYFLYTGKVGYWTPTKTLSLILMFIFNALACYAICYLFSLTRLDNAYAIHIANLKMHDNLISLFILGIGCGAMMHIAYYMFEKGHHPLYVIMPVMLFLVCGFEHCVADAGYIGLAQMLPDLGIVLRLFVIAIGNAVGSLMLTKLLNDPTVAQH